MSAAQAIALVSRYLEAVHRQDIEAILACLADGVMHDANQGARRIGKTAFAEFCTHMARCYEERLEGTVIMATPDGTRAAAEFNIVGIYRETDPGLPPARGQTYRLPGAALFAIEGPSIIRVTSYFNVTDWLTQIIDNDA